MWIAMWMMHWTAETALGGRAKRGVWLRRTSGTAMGTAGLYGGMALRTFVGAWPLCLRKVCGERSQHAMDR